MTKFQIAFNFFKIAKLSPMISSKKLPWTLKYCPELCVTWKLAIFLEMESLFHKSKNFWKTENFSRRSLLLFQFFLTGFLNFGCQSYHLALTVVKFLNKQNCLAFSEKNFFLIIKIILCIFENFSSFVTAKINALKKVHCENFLKILHQHF